MNGEGIKIVTKNFGVPNSHKLSTYTGRGGAFFATGMKWSFVPKPEANPNPHYLVVNADESEPGSFKDNEIISRVPHRFIEGCLITAHAVDSKNVFVYIRGEYLDPFEILVGALEELRDRPEIRGDVTIVVHRGAGAYICGEETALIESLEGKRGQPSSRSNASTTCCAPTTAHDKLVHTSTRCSPTGARWYWS